MDASSARNRLRPANVNLPVAEDDQPVATLLRDALEHLGFEIEHARDCGITEYLIKPFTAKSLCDRIAMLVEARRSFFASKEYKGLSRRRKASDESVGTERRRRRPSLR